MLQYSEAASPRVEQQGQTKKANRKGGQEVGTFTKAVTDSSWETDVMKSSTPVLVDFWAEWCGPCKALGPKLEEIAQEMGAKVAVLKLDVDANQEAAVKFGVRSIPTMILFKNGKAVDQIMGNHPKDSIVEFITRNL